MLGNLIEIRINQVKLFGTSNGKVVDYVFYGANTIPKLNAKIDEAVIKFREGEQIRIHDFSTTGSAYLQPVISI